MKEDVCKEDENTINEILSKIRNDEYRIIENLDRTDFKNENFKIGWKANFVKICKMVKLVESSDYLYTINNKDCRIKTDKLHIFRKEYSLVNAFAKCCNVWIFIKIGVIKDKYVLLVSFHENEPK